MECVNLALEITLRRRLRGFFRGITYTVMYDFIILQRCLGNLTHMKTWYAESYRPGCGGFTQETYMASQNSSVLPQRSFAHALRGFYVGVYSWTQHIASFSLPKLTLVKFLRQLSQTGPIHSCILLISSQDTDLPIGNDNPQFSVCIILTANTRDHIHPK